MNWSSDWGDRPAEADPWSSIVDLMSAFALVLFLAVTFFILNYNNADKKLKQKEKILLEQRSLLVKKEKQLNQSFLDLKNKDRRLLLSQNARAELKAIEQKLLNDKKALAALIAQQQEEKKALAAMLAQQQGEKKVLAGMIKQQQALVRSQREETDKQRRFFKSAKASQQRCERQLQALLDQKKKVLTAIYRVFSTRKQKSGSVGFDPRTGKFRLGGDILFSEGMAVLTLGGKAQLKQVLQALDRVLLQPNVRPMIAGIMIEGHTNARGRLSRNWELSSQRAVSALQHILSLVKKDPRRYKVYSRLLFAGAFGPFRPIRNARGVADPRRSRRIEIKVLFHNQQKLRQILQRQLK